MQVNCEYCGNEFSAKPSDLKRGYGRFCNKSCAASFREKSKPGYDQKKVKNNNRKRALWFNKYRTLELEQRKKFPEKTDEEIWLIMYNLTEDPIFLNVETREIFIF